MADTFETVAHDDSAAPAMKEDICLLIEQSGKLYDANARWKDEIIEHFDVAVETIRHEMKAAHHDSIEMLRDQSDDHAKRIERLERHAGLAA
jgi:predicted metal-dependent hydrolase